MVDWPEVNEHGTYMDKWGFANYFKYFETLCLFVLPLLHMLFTAQRYVVICCPDHIPKYCTKKKTLITVSCVVILSVLASIHELFDNNKFYLENRKEDLFVVKSRMHEHEQYSSTTVMYLLVIGGVSVSVASLILTRKMNNTLNKNLLFLHSMEANRHAKRIQSYEHLKKFNVSTLIAIILALGLKLSQFFYAELMVHKRVRSWHEHSIMDWLTSLMELCSCLHLIVFPLFVILFLPAFRVLKAKIRCINQNHDE